MTSGSRENKSIGIIRVYTIVECNLSVAFLIFETAHGTISPVLFLGGGQTDEHHLSWVGEVYIACMSMEDAVQ